MAGQPGPEAGESLSCPDCGQEVMKKSMIPIRGNDGVQLLCRTCARKHVVKQPG